jgi:hypothetical protein
MLKEQSERKISVPFLTISTQPDADDSDDALLSMADGILSAGVIFRRCHIKNRYPNMCRGIEDRCVPMLPEAFTVCCPLCEPRR